MFHRRRPLVAGDIVDDNVHMMQFEAGDAARAGSPHLPGNIAAKGGRRA
jgi:hypothetical protein